MTTDVFLLAALVTCGVTVQTTAGFGALLTCVTIGALRWPIAELVPVLIPAMIVQAAWIVVRHHDHVRWQFLAKRVLPVMMLGMVAAMVLAGRDVSAFRPLLGVVILILGARELLRRTTPPPPPPWQSTGGILGAGFLHGLFATGGPLLVWSIGRQGLTKTELRTTLNAVWMVLNTVMVAMFVAREQVTASTLGRTAWVLPAVGLGLLVGERLHHQVNEARFRLLVWALLCVAALPLLIPR